MVVKSPSTAQILPHKQNNQSQRVDYFCPLFFAYTYDLLGRLICENGKHYEYDVAGNRTQAIVDIDTTVCYTYNSDGELISETSNNGSVSETTTYTYDANGNLTTKTKGINTTNYAYDVWGNMVSAGDATYTYRADGIRISKTHQYLTNQFTVVGGNVWKDFFGTYTRGIELISNGRQIYLYNIRGDVIQLLKFDGSIYTTYDYDAYGNEYERDNNDGNYFRYCGEYYDTETGFIYLRARYYDPMVGRFTSVDPIKDGLNWYAYCEGNPVIFKDNNGLFPIVALFIAAVVTSIAHSSYEFYKDSLMSQNYEHNFTLDENPETTTKNRIINGQALSDYADFRYGLFDNGFNTCEVIAIHNAKKCLGMESTLSQTIYDVQKCDGMWLLGLFGTYPGKTNNILNYYGIRYTNIESVDGMSEKGMYIISYWDKNDKDVFWGIHTIAVEYDGGLYHAYNLFGTSPNKNPIDLDDIRDYYINGFYIPKD